MPGFYAADGSWNISAETAANNRGKQAGHGGLNMSKTSAGGVGIHGPSGQMRITYTATNVNSRYAPDGSLYVTTTPYVQGAQRVTVVSGALP